MDKPFAKDARPAAAFARYHRRARGRVPWLQTLLLLALAPVLHLLTRVRVEGRENIPDGGYIVACNHPSLLDALFVAVAIRRRVRFMGKSELFNDRWGGLLSRVGGFPVRRGVWDEEAFATAQKVLDCGRVMAIFPGGGIDPEGGYRQARPGVGHIAHRAGAVVLPVHLEGTRSLYRPRVRTRVKVRVGEPFRAAQDPEPSRELCQRTADRALAAIRQLAE